LSDLKSSDLGDAVEEEGEDCHLAIFGVGGWLELVVCSLFFDMNHDVDNVEDGVIELVIFLF
jgi:hypothetical protein